MNKGLLLALIFLGSISISVLFGWLATKPFKIVDQFGMESRGQFRETDRLNIAVTVGGSSFVAIWIGLIVGLALHDVLTR